MKTDREKREKIRQEYIARSREIEGRLVAKLVDSLVLDAFTNEIAEEMGITPADLDELDQIRVVADYLARHLQKTLI